MSGKLKMLGMDGVFTFILSNAVIALTLGVTLIPSLIKVVKIAVASPCQENDSECLLVFGLRLLNDEVTKSYVSRLRRAHQIFLVNPQVSIFILGGATSGNSISEAMKGKEWLIQQGVSRQNIQTEDQSLNTLENLKNARRILTLTDSKICLVTNRYHLYRVSRLANGMSLAHSLCAAENEWRLSLSTLGSIFIETYYIHWYEVGRTWSYLTGNKKSIKRISS